MIPSFCERMNKRIKEARRAVRRILLRLYFAPLQRLYLGGAVVKGGRVVMTITPLDATLFEAQP